MHLINTILLGAGAISMASAATTPQYLNIGTLNSNTPSGINTPAYATITFQDQSLHHLHRQMGLDQETYHFMDFLQG
jgi:phosphoserine aminotransferase